MWVDTMQAGGEQGEVSAEAIALVREQLGQAAKVQGQIAQAGKQNQQFAQLLLLLLQHIADEKLIGHIFRQLTVLKIGIPAIFAQFLPFIMEYVHMQVSSWPFAELLPKAKQMPRSLDGLVTWMHDVFLVFPQLTKQTEEQKASLVIDLAQTYEFTNLEKLSEDQRTELRELVKSEMKKL